MKHSEAMFRVALFLAALATSFFINSPAFSFSTNNTHPALTQEVAGLFNAQNKQKLSPEEINWLRQGAIEEDEPMRYNNHFYNPATGNGWSGKYFGSLSPAEGLAKGADSAPRAPIASIDWVANQAIQAAYGRQYGNQTWQKAIKSYIDGDKKSAFIALGHTMHLIEDMAVPDHTRDDTHAGIYGDPGSPFEEYAKNYTNFNKLTIAQNLVNQNKSIPNYQTIQDAFIGLANYSNRNFFSEDTISNEEFSEPNVKNLVVVSKQIDSTTIRKYLFSNNIYLSWITNEDPLTGNRNYSTKEQSFVLPSYRDHLFPQAVLTGAGVMELFFKEVEKYQKNPESLGPITPDQSESLLSIIMHAPKLAILNTYDAWDKVVVSTQVALAKSKSLVQGLVQKVKLATATSAPPSPSIQGQVLGEQVEASNITAPITPPPVVLAATSTPEQAVKKEEKKSVTTIVAKENIKSNSPNSINEIAARPAVARNDNKESGLRDDSNEVGAFGDLAGKDDNIEPSNPHPSFAKATEDRRPTLSLEGRGNNKLAPARQSVSYFIGIHAPSNPHPTLSLEGRGDNNIPPQNDPPTPDTIPPTTQITLLPATTTTASFLVQWNGTDNIQITPASYDIQYRIMDSRLRGNDNGGGGNDIINDWLDWELATSSTSSIFIGQDEKTYGFRSRGYDQENNQSTYPNTAETYTYLNLSVPTTPSITSHTNNQTITDSDDIASTTTGVQINLSGTADPQDIITITLSETLSTSTTTASSTGAWTTILTLAEGANTITLQAQEADGDVSSSTTIILNLNTTPSVISDLAIDNSAITATSTRLVWTAPDQGNLNITGSSAYYDFRYLSGPSCAITETDFGSLSQAPNSPIPSLTAGTSESFTVNNLIENTNYCFGVKTYNGLRFSNLSNIATITLPLSHGTDISQTATSTNKDWGWNNTGSWSKIAQSFQPTRDRINGFEFSLCRRYPNGWGGPGLRVILCKGLPASPYLGGCDSGNVANNVLYRKDYTSAETDALIPFCGGWNGVPLRKPDIINFSFSAITLIPGQTYSIIFSASPFKDMEPFQSSYQIIGNPYVGGEVYYQDNNGSFKTWINSDWYFKTLY